MKHIILIISLLLLAGAEYASMPLSAILLACGVLLYIYVIYINNYFVAKETQLERKLFYAGFLFVLVGRHFAYASAPALVLVLIALVFIIIGYKVKYDRVKSIEKLFTYNWKSI